MEFSQIFVPHEIWIELPGAPVEFKTMKPRRIENGDLFDAEIQFIEKKGATPIYVGEITDCFYDHIPRTLELHVNMSSNLLYGRWVMVDLSVSPAADTTTDTEGIITPSYWKLNGIGLNHADAEEGPAVLASMHPLFDVHINIS